MKYRVSYHRQIEKQLDRIPDHIFEKFQERIEELKRDPFRTPHVKKLTNREGYSLRSGDYRLLFEVNTRNKEIRILAVRHRRDAYR